MKATYSPLNVHENADVEHSHRPISSTSPVLERVSSFTNSYACPISKPPSSPRDILYGILFIIHLIGIFILVSYEEKVLANALTIGDIDSWTSLGMITSLLGSFITCILLAVLIKSRFRDALLNVSFQFVIAFEVCFANVLFLLNTKFSFIGIISLFSAAIDVTWIKPAKENVNFISALISSVLEINKHFYYDLIFISLVLLILQTCYCFIFCMITVTFLSVISTEQKYFTLFCLFLSFAWTTLVFRHSMNFIVSCTFLWFYAIDNNNITNTTTINSNTNTSNTNNTNSANSSSNVTLTGRVFLTFKCAIFSNFGTICKVSLFSTFSEMILRLERWCLGSRHQIPSKYSLTWMLYSMLTPFLEFSKYNHSYYLGYTALYGLTLYKSHDELNAHSELLAIHSEDVSGFILNSLSVISSGFIAMLFGLLAHEKEGEEWPLFFMFCFYLAYTGVSFGMNAIRSAINGLILASVLFPTRFQEEHPIIYSRFNRLGKIELR